MAQEESRRRGRLLPLLAWTGGVGLLVALTALAASTCGPSPLAKSFEAYDATAESLLDEDLALWKKLLPLFNAQIRDEGASIDRYETLVRKEAVPLYDRLATEIAALEPAAELKPAHDLLVQHAKARAEFAHLLAANIDVLRPQAAGAELGAKQSAAQYAMQEYDKWAHEDQTRVADSRFTELVGIHGDFTDRLEKFQSHRMARADMDDFIRKDAIPRVKKLRAGRFDEDRPSGLLRDAIATTQEFYAAFADSLPMLERQAAFGEETEQLAKKGDDLLKKFREELQAVRRKL